MFHFLCFMSHCLQFIHLFNKLIFIYYFFTFHVFRSSEEENKSNLLHKHQELFSQGFNQTNITIPVVDLDRNILVLSGLTIALFFVGFIRGLLYFKVAVDASKTLHNKMFNSIIRVPVAFFDNNPVGKYYFSYKIKCI